MKWKLFLSLIYNTGWGTQLLRKKRKFEKYEKDMFLQFDKQKLIGRPPDNRTPDYRNFEFWILSWTLELIVETEFYAEC